MFQPIDEKVTVAGVYRGSKFQPKRFLWRDKIFDVEAVTFVADVKNGGTKRRRYSVTSGPNAYRLLFDRLEESWRLEEVWVD